VFIIKSFYQANNRSKQTIVTIILWDYIAIACYDRLIIWLDKMIDKMTW
jgi:hypothetical protein